MGPLFVISLQPFGADLPHLLQGFKHVGVQHFRAIGPIISLDEGMLIRFPRLNISELNRPLCTPGDEALGEEFRPIVEPNRLRLALPSHDLLQHAHHPFRGQRRIHFDR
jgi:hypothetical protein